jgi:hypothetical protein
MKAADLRAQLVKTFMLGGSEVHTTDGEYFLPSLVWLGSEFSRIVQDEFHRNRPTAESWDCDDAALQAMVLARRANRQRGSGIAFGYVGGMLTREVNGIKAGIHATNLVLCNDGNLYLYEPQNGKITRADSVGFDFLVTLVLM